METPQIAFIGAGNMASSIIGGLIDSGHPAEQISAADPHPPTLEKLKDMAPVVVYSSNTEAISAADVVILAVKPQAMAEATESIARGVAETEPVIISIAAGVTIASIQARLGTQAAIVRCMPNTPALLGCGASALYANNKVSDQQREHAQTILSAVGITRWVDNEQALDAITALSGSGPAYFFLFLESLIDAGVDLGLDRETATTMALQTALGASRMALEGEVELGELRRRVTSPGGTTERALESFKSDNLGAVVERAVRAAADRAAELAVELS
ncbi:MAG: pyrroline-5-carboxylate reductase [Halieaceae bacterium]|nr:pyrroline-5-carboxylate reductase [Halieaceae bacterium]